MMLPWMFTCDVRRHERALRFRDGCLVAVLAPGRHRLWPDPLGLLLGHRPDRVEFVGTLDPVIPRPLVEHVLATPALAASVLVVELDQHERAHLWRNGQLIAVLGPGRHALWAPSRTEPVRLQIERFDVLALLAERERLLGTAV